MERGVEPAVVQRLTSVIYCVFVRVAPRAVRFPGESMRGGGQGETNGLVAKVRNTLWFT